MSQLRKGLTNAVERADQERRKKRRGEVKRALKRPRKSFPKKTYHPCAKCGAKIQTKWKFCRACSALRGSNRYLAYLRSPRWAKIRAAALARAQWQCERCGKAANQVHHRTYARLMNEEPEDLEALCALCHAVEHGKVKAAQDVAPSSASAKTSRRSVKSGPSS